MSGAPGNFANRASPPPSGSTSSDAAMVAAMINPVRVVVAASRTSGHTAYQAWK